MIIAIHDLCDIVQLPVVSTDSWSHQLEMDLPYQLQRQIHM